jgi:hypothetical protein
MEIDDSKIAGKFLFERKINAKIFWSFYRIFLDLDADFFPAAGWSGLGRPSTRL